MFRNFWRGVVRALTVSKHDRDAINAFYNAHPELKAEIQAGITAAENAALAALEAKLSVASGQVVALIQNEIITLLSHVGPKL